MKKAGITRKGRIVGESKSFARYSAKSEVFFVSLEKAYKLPPSQRPNGKKEIEIKTKEIEAMTSDNIKVCKGAFLKIEKLFLKDSLTLFLSMIAAG
jgi:topoisomerase IA-like protein